MPPTSIKRGEQVDIHDVELEDSYDVLISDVWDGILRSELSDIIGIPYLQKATKNEASTIVEKLEGPIFPPHLRMVFPCVVGYEGT